MQASWPNGYGVGLQIQGSPLWARRIYSFCKSSFCTLQLEEAHANEINHDIHLANTLFQIKVRYKNMTSVCSGLSLFMLALSCQCLRVN